MLTLFRRHKIGCKHTSREDRRCSCPIHVEGRLGNRRIRQSLKLTSWEAAQRKVREWEADGQIAEEAEPITVLEAIAQFMEDCRARNLSAGTLGKYHHLLERRLADFCALKGIEPLADFAPADCRKFRAGWADSPISAAKNLERLKAFFRFCLANHYLAENPVQGLKPPLVRLVPTLPFSKEEFREILAGAGRVDEFHYHGQGNKNRLLRSFVLLLRYSGLRIGDALTVGPHRLKGSTLHLYSQKTGHPVSVPLPKFVLESFETFEPCSSKYFFWTGEGKLKTRVANMQRSLGRVFELAGIQGGHAHRFRDTFAVELLQRGVSLETVSILLGHSSIRITEKHYAPWVKSRQEALERAVRLAWEEGAADTPAGPPTPESAESGISGKPASSTRVH